MKLSVISLAIALTSALVAASPAGFGDPAAQAACDAKCGQECGARNRVSPNQGASQVVLSTVASAKSRMESRKFLNNCARPKLVLTVASAAPKVVLHVRLPRQGLQIKTVSQFLY
ncbi:hypothetical protein LZ30DRAFT_476587 [Colletotrichum cereale]|nr:hypothetical protein LZ30DRAFT_476587 [Colletotrichum cereale]